MHSFDPSLYDRKTNIDADPALGEAEWIERFVAHLIAEGTPVADESFKAEVPEYARRVARDYLQTRKDYVTPEEAADTDISYWEDDE
jgi:hypothetical protein